MHTHSLFHYFSYTCSQVLFLNSFRLSLSLCCSRSLSLPLPYLSLILSYTLSQPFSHTHSLIFSHTLSHLYSLCLPTLSVTLSNGPVIWRGLRAQTSPMTRNYVQLFRTFMEISINFVLSEETWTTCWVQRYSCRRYQNPHRIWVSITIQLQFSSLRWLISPQDE